MTGGELVARTLKGAGVGHVFTLCGGHILPIYDGCLGEAITLVDVRHEQAAAHCADAYARLTRRVGVAVVAPGPGVTDAVTGVANAYAARSPVLLMAGGARQALRGLAALQEMEQIALVRWITKGAWTVAETRQIPEVLTSAIRTALSGRPGPVFVEIPVDLLMATVEDRLAPIPRLSVHRPRPAADSDALAHLERLLAAATRPVVVAGGGVYWDDPAESLAAFAERAGDLDVILRQLSTVVPATLAERTAPWLTAVRARETESRGRLDGFCASEQVPVSHYRLAAEIARVVSPETIVVGDGGDIVGCA